MKSRMMRPSPRFFVTILLTLLSTAALLPALPSAAFAQTPDDDTPEVDRVGGEEKDDESDGESGSLGDDSVKEVTSEQEKSSAKPFTVSAPTDHIVEVPSIGTDQTPHDSTTINVTPQSAPQGSAPSQKIDNWHTDGFNAYFQLSSEGYFYNDLDFRPIAPPTAPFIDILDSDDRSLYASTSIAAGLNYTPIDAITAALSLSYSGKWGAQGNGSKGVDVERFFVKWNIWSDSVASISTTVGRQKFAIGAFQNASKLQGLQPREFLLSDVIDGVTVDLNFNQYGKLRLLPLDFYVAGGRPQPKSKKGKASSSAFRFNGNYNTIRAGLIYENTQLINGLSMRGFFFYASIGANGSGADRSFNGATGNQADNDYTWMGGARVNYTWEATENFALGIGAEYARSGGIDRKPIQAGFYDVDTNGNAYGVSLIPALSLNSISVAFPIQFFMADGNRYAKADGLPYSHGFSSFKGQSVGGLLLSGDLGWTPSAYVNDGIKDAPNDKARAAGTMALSAGISATFFNKALQTTLTAWYLADTSKTNFPVDDAAAVTQASSNAAFGWTRADIEAERRYGKPLATEVDLGITYSPYSILSINAVGGVLIPGSFYKIEIDRTVGNFIGSANPTTGWGATLGITLSL